MMIITSVIKKFLRRFVDDRRGASAIEFAIIAPIMILIFFGTAELSQGISADRKVTLAARTMSDLVARTDKVDSNELKNIFTAASYIMRPFPSTDFKATITAITIDSTGAATVAWRVNLTLSGSTAAITNSSDKTVGALPAALKVSNTPLIKSEVSYPYKPGSAYFIKTLSLAETFYARPRMDNKIVKCETCT